MKAARKSEAKSNRTLPAEEALPSRESKSLADSISFQPNLASKTDPPELRSYPAPFHGKMVLACKKCMKKLKGSREHESVAKLKRSLRNCVKRAIVPVELKVIPVSCMKLCPKGGVTVCTQAQMAAAGGPRVSIVRNQRDVEMLYASCVSNELHNTDSRS